MAEDAPEKFVNVVDDLSADDRRARLTFDRRVLAHFSADRLEAKGACSYDQGRDLTRSPGTHQLHGRIE